MTVLKLVTKRIAIAAGKTKIAETSNDPVIGMIKLIATPVIIEINNEIPRTGSPAVAAVCSSNKSTYNGRRKIMYKATTRAVKMNKVQICCSSIVTIDPNRNCSILFVCCPDTKLISTNATAIPVDMRIAIEISE